LHLRNIKIILNGRSKEVKRRSAQEAGQMR